MFRIARVQLSQESSPTVQLSDNIGDLSASMSPELAEGSKDG